LGHAVVLDDLAHFPHWNAPEDFASAVCVPVSTPTVPLGTLWIFCDRARDFTSHETGILEMAAGRLAADLEREMLLSEGLEGHRLKRQLVGAERVQRSQLPRVSPLVDGWEVAACCDQRDTLGGDFYDWFPLSRGPRWAFAIGDALHAGVEGAIVATNVRAALRTHAQAMHDPGRLITGVNRTFWTSSAGDQSASLACLAVEPDSGCVRLAMAGTVGLLAMQSDGAWHSMSRPTLSLGREPTERYQTLQFEIGVGDVLIAYTEGYQDARDGQGITLGEQALAEAITPHLTAPIDQIADAIRATFERHAKSHDDRTLVVIRRREPGRRTT
jgi:sigma-B regulation protein RsbU (phosphoserine phosphatase)